MQAETQRIAAVPPSTSSDSMLKRIARYKIGIIPVYVYVPLMAIIGLLMGDGKLPKDMLGATMIMVLFGFLLGEIGNRIPLLKNVGGGSILATFGPSFLVAHHWLPKVAIDSVTTFMKSSNFLYVFIAIVIVGSILSMNRQILIKAFFRMFVPLLAGSIVSMAVGVGVGTLLGIGAYKSFFYIVVPIMAGGVGEGAMPLSIAYASILHQSQETNFAQILPCVMLGSLCAIILSGLLKRLGEKRPELTGNGMLVKTGDEELLKLSEQQQPKAKMFDPSIMAVGAALAIGLYLLGVYVSNLTGLPGPIIMLFVAVLIKLSGKLPKSLEDGSHMAYRFFVVAVTFPLLMAVGVASTPWDSLISVFKPTYLITIFLTVFSMVATGFFVGKWMKMYPIETAIVTACHSGQGGTGDVAILTASNRLVLMPFAQVSTRIFGAITVTLATILLRYLQ